MVSNIDPPNQLVPRRPPSVSSRTSAPRRHGSSRSHHASPSSSPFNEFPVFTHTGDVEIIIASANGRKEQRYLLHTIILSQCSAFFQLESKHPPILPAASTSTPAVHTSAPSSLSRIGENDSTSTSSLASADNRRWTYALDWDKTRDGDVPTLVQRPQTKSPPPVSRNKPPASSSSFFRSMSNLSALNLNAQPSTPPGPEDHIMRDYDNLFRTFYNYPPALDAVNIANAYTESKALLHLADLYGALPVVSSRVDHHLLRFQGRLFKQIARFPPSYLKLACLAKSRVIFAEALIHVVGQWPQAQPQLDNQVDPIVLDIIQDKVQELDDIKLRVEARLFRLTLTTSRGERVNPSNSYLDWLAMSLWRQWLAENTTPAPVSILKQSTPHPSHDHAASASASVSARSSRGATPSSRALVTTKPAPVPPIAQNAGRIYRLIGSTHKDAYLGHDELKRFLKLTPEMYSRENLRRFERRMDELKNLARDTVKPLIRNFLELDLSATNSVPSSQSRGAPTTTGSLGYLTCTKVLEEDFPWDDD